MKPKAKRQHRLNRHKRVRSKITGTKNKPRVAVFKSNRHIFVQFIDDTTGKTLLSNKIISNKKTKIKGNKTIKAGSVGEMLAEKAKELGITGRWNSSSTGGILLCIKGKS